jgi:Lon protease-like protein
MAADQGVIDSVSNVNTKNLGDAAAFAMGLAYGDAVAHQRAMNSIREASVGAVVKSLVQVDPIESTSVNKLLTGNDLASQIAALLAALNANQQGVKSAGTTPPVTI